LRATARQFNVTRATKLLSVALADLFELQRRILRVGFEQRKLFVGTDAHVRRERPVFPPKARGRAMLHAPLKRLNTTVLFVIQSVGNGVVETACRKVGLKAGIDGLGVVLIQPSIQFRQLRRRQSFDGTFDILHRGYVHECPSIYF
jgi:hypothetical protein